MIFHKGVNVVFMDTHGAANARGGELLAPDEFLDGTRVYLDVVRSLFGCEPSILIGGACVWFLLFLTHIYIPVSYHKNTSIRSTILKYTWIHENA
jgi:hypothetical protein